MVWDGRGVVVVVVVVVVLMVLIPVMNGPVQEAAVI